MGKPWWASRSIIFGAGLVLTGIFNLYFEYIQGTKQVSAALILSGIGMGLFRFLTSEPIRRE